MQVELTTEEISLLTQLLSQVPALAPAGLMVIDINKKLHPAPAVTGAEDVKV